MKYPFLYRLALALCAGCNAASTLDGDAAGPADAHLLDCSTAACFTSFTVNLTHSGAWPDGTYQFVAVADGVTTTCTASLPGGSNSCGTGYPPTLWVARTNGSAALAPFSFSVDGSTPASVSLRVSRDGMLLVEQSFAPSYTAQDPNGPACLPHCMVAAASLAVP